jgi:hypothetical protein
MATRREDDTDCWDSMSDALRDGASPSTTISRPTVAPAYAMHPLRLGWLDPAHVVTWQHPTTSGEMTSRLSALSSPETGEALALRVEDRIVAFHFPEAWDNGLPRPHDMLHTEEMLANAAAPMLTSALQSAASGRQDGQVGDVLDLMGGADNTLIARFSDDLALRVDAIIAQRTATMSVVFVEGRHEFEIKPKIQR